LTWWSALNSALSNSFVAVSSASKTLWSYNELVAATVPGSGLLQFFRVAHLIFPPQPQPGYVDFGHLIKLMAQNSEFLGSIICALRHSANFFCRFMHPLPFLVERSYICARGMVGKVGNCIVGPWLIGGNLESSRLIRKELCATRLLCLLAPGCRSLIGCSCRLLSWFVCMSIFF
jgi:hypothetical protein